MIISDAARLWLYIAMGVLPVWSDWLAKSADYTPRGLAMPILASLSTAVAIALAKTSTKKDAPQDPIEVTAPKGKPLPVTEVEPAAPKRAK